jgi:hypothetical protein
MSFQEHMNSATGKWTNNEAQFKSDLARASDEASEYTGITHKFVPMDWRDMPKYELEDK